MWESCFKCKLVLAFSFAKYTQMRIWIKNVRFLPQIKIHAYTWNYMQMHVATRYTHVITCTVYKYYMQTTCNLRTCRCCNPFSWYSSYIPVMRLKTVGQTCTSSCPLNARSLLHIAYNKLLLPSFFTSLKILRLLIGREQWPLIIQWI